MAKAKVAAKRKSSKKPADPVADRMWGIPDDDYNAATLSLLHVRNLLKVVSDGLCEINEEKDSVLESAIARLAEASKLIIAARRCRSEETSHGQ